jgi:prepilin-type N-terminal cleavage/methylation domain-containing protein
MEPFPLAISFAPSFLNEINPLRETLGNTVWISRHLRRSLLTTVSRKAFTLIELLIVVAIIAILAAIAVPNFLEAQTRAKVSRAKADMRSLATAIESYVVDNNRPPEAFIAEERGTFNGRMFQLTSPIAYMSSLPTDPFRIQRRGLFPDPSNFEAPPTFDYNDIFTVTGGIPGRKFPTLYFANQQALVAFFDNNSAIQWFIFSPGPRFQQLPFIQGFQNTAELNPGGYPTVPHSFSTAPANFNLTHCSYDPTNGTVSVGQIWRTNIGQRN